MSKWSDLTKKPPAELSDGERVAIEAVISASVTTHTNLTMEEIFDELLGKYFEILGLTR